MRAITVGLILITTASLLVGCGPSREFVVSAKTAMASAEALDGTAFDQRSTDSRIADVERFLAEMKGKASGDEEQYISKLVSRYANGLITEVKIGKITGNSHLLLAYSTDLSAQDKAHLNAIKTCHDEAEAMLAGSAGRTGQCDIAFRAEIDSITGK